MTLFCRCDGALTQWWCDAAAQSDFLLWKAVKTKKSALFDLCVCFNLLCPFWRLMVAQPSIDYRPVPAMCICVIWCVCVCVTEEDAELMNTLNVPHDASDRSRIHSLQQSPGFGHSSPSGWWYVPLPCQCIWAMSNEDLNENKQHSRWCLLLVFSILRYSSVHALWR